METVYAQESLHLCTGLPELSLVTIVESIIFNWFGSVILSTATTASFSNYHVSIVCERKSRNPILDQVLHLLAVWVCSYII